MAALAAAREEVISSSTSLDGDDILEWGEEGIEEEADENTILSHQTAYRSYGNQATDISFCNASWATRQVHQLYRQTIIETKSNR